MNLKSIQTHSNTFKRIQIYSKMGQQTSAPRLSKEKRHEREQLKKQAVEIRKQDIQHAQEQLLKNNSNKPQNAIIPTSDLATVFQITETAKNQLDRGGSNLTKSDLIAIILALEPQYRKQFKQMGELTTSDLNAMIRNIIYDPNRILQTENPPNHQNNLTASISSKTNQIKDSISQKLRIAY